jgi:hypothetical protein
MMKTKKHKFTYTAKRLEFMPTISKSHFADLKLDYWSCNTDRQTRVWLSRMTVADGMPYDNYIRVEQFSNGRWVTVAEYQG